MVKNLKNIGWDKYIDVLLLVFLIGFPLVGSLFRVEMMSKCIVYIIFALSLDILWGSAGLMNLGQAIFFGLGGYVLALSYATRGGIPAFMSGYGVTEIPWFMQILHSTPVAVLLGMLIPGVVAGLLGYFIFTSKVKGVFFNIITLSLASLIELFFTNQQKYTGGANGISGLPPLSIGSEPLSVLEHYYVMLAVGLLVYLFCRWLTNSRFGMILRSVRENESRLQFFGFNPATFKLTIFVISGMIAGLAGMLYIPIHSFVSPGNIGVVFSTSVLVWLAVGGRGNLTGAMVGAFLITWMESLLSEQFADVWLLVLGFAMLAMVMFFPKGLVGTLLDWQYSRKVDRQLEQMHAEDDEMGLTENDFATAKGKV
ncbi:MAG TPA: urea ABC transporter permease subunit UrtC [Negativicutes bacterium]|nr:urea ABC transporter permease subunit UrtC [Negativicutes bacterium]